MAKLILRMEPYNPDAIDGDGDGIVQEWTPWERPGGTRLLDSAGKEIKKGATVAQRPAGMKVVDREGKQVNYTPTYSGGALGAGIGAAGGAAPKKKETKIKPTPLTEHGAPSLRELGLKTVRSIQSSPEPSRAVPSEAPSTPEVGSPVQQVVSTGIDKATRHEFQQILDQERLADTTAMFVHEAQGLETRQNLIAAIQRDTPGKQQEQEPKKRGRLARLWKRQKDTPAPAEAFRSTPMREIAQQFSGRGRELLEQLADLEEATPKNDEEFIEMMTKLNWLHRQMFDYATEWDYERGGFALLNDLLEGIGFTGDAQLLSPEEFEERMRAVARVLYRGVDNNPEAQLTARQIIAQLWTGAFWQGNGTYGQGTYFAGADANVDGPGVGLPVWDEATIQANAAAIEHARRYGPLITRALLDPEADLADHAEIIALSERIRAAIVQRQMFADLSAIDPVNQEIYAHNIQFFYDNVLTRFFTFDPSMVAAMYGYDVMRTTPLNMVILNRTALISDQKATVAEKMITELPDPSVPEIATPAPLRAIPKEYAPGQWSALTVEEAVERQLDELRSNPDLVALAKRRGEDLDTLLRSLTVDGRAIRSDYDRGLRYWVNGRYELIAQGEGDPAEVMSDEVRERVFRFIDRFEAFRPAQGWSACRIELVSRQQMETLQPGQGNVGGFSMLPNQRLIDGEAEFGVPPMGKIVLLGSMFYGTSGEVNKVITPAMRAERRREQHYACSVTGLQEHLHCLVHELAHGTDMSLLDPDFQNQIEALYERHRANMSRYARESAREAYAEHMTDWITSRGRTQNAITLSYANEFGWEIPE